MTTMIFNLSYIILDLIGNMIDLKEYCKMNKNIL